MSRHRGAAAAAGIRYDCSMLAEDETVFLLLPDRGRPRFLSDDRTLILDDLPQRRVSGGEGVPEEAIAKYIGSRVHRRRRREAGEDHEGGGVCVVCQDDLVEANGRIATLDCAHEFHAPCIGRWLRRSNTCPLCKATVILTSSMNS